MSYYDSYDEMNPIIEHNLSNVSEEPKRISGWLSSNRKKEKYVLDEF
jgi:hypothetical protein